MCVIAQVRMGFPQRNAEGFAGAAFVGAECRLSAGGYTCPRCRARVAELPSRCSPNHRLPSVSMPLHALMARHCLLSVLRSRPACVYVHVLACHRSDMFSHLIFIVQSPFHGLFVPVTPSGAC